nr:hypothetical protein [Tanacetum cinerariifolium]
PNEEFSDDTIPNVARKFLNEKAAKFAGDFKSLAKEADESLAKHKALELEIERLLRAVVSQDIMSVVQNASVVDTSNLQTELERTKERFENCIIKKENEYATLWNDWYKMCDECKFDKISYDKAYKDMQQQIERLQAQLGDLKGKSKDTSCVSDTLNPLSQKLKNENVELKFQEKHEEAAVYYVNLKAEDMKSMRTQMYHAFKGQPPSAPSSSQTITLALTDILANVEGENIKTATEDPTTKVPVTEEPVVNQPIPKEGPSHTEGETTNIIFKGSSKSQPLTQLNNPHS